MLVCGDVVYAQTCQVLTLKNCIEPLSYASTAYFVAWPLFPFDCFVKIWATCKNFLGKWITAPPGKKLPVRLCYEAYSHERDMTMCLFHPGFRVMDGLLNRKYFEIFVGQTGKLSV